MIVGVVRPCLSRLTTREAVLSVALGLFCGWGLVIVIPVMPPLSLMPEHWLQVIATGEKNSLSKSPAVSVVGLMDRRTCRLVANVDNFQQDGNWQALKSGCLFTNAAGTLTWHGRVTSAVALKLSTSPTAGKVRVLWDGKEHLLDLYSPAESATPKTILLDLAATPDYWTPKRTCVCLCAALGMALPFTVICLWLVSRKTSVAADVPRGTLASWTWPGYGLPLLLAGAGYLAIFPPALMSNDSLGQWSQMLSGGYSDVAPIFHTMTNWLITRLWFSPAAVAWTQLVAMSLVTAWTLKRLRQWGLSRTLAWATSGLVAIMPAAGILSITLWKDIPYTICMLILALMVMETIQSRGQWLRTSGFRLLAGPRAGDDRALSPQRAAGCPGNAAPVGHCVYRQGLRPGLGPAGRLRTCLGRARPSLSGGCHEVGCIANLRAGWHARCEEFLQGRRRRQPYCRSDGVRHAPDG